MVSTMGTRSRGSAQQHAERGDLECLLDYELRRSTRYRHYVSLVMVSDRNGSEEGVRQILAGSLRRSDQLFAWGHAAVILMSETDEDGAQKAVARFKRNCRDDRDLCFAVTTYPLDGQNPAQLLTRLEERLERARSLERGVVVSSG